MKNNIMKMMIRMFVQETTIKSMPHEDEIRNNHERKGNQRRRHCLLDVDKRDEVHQAEIKNQSTEHGIS